MSCKGVILAALVLSGCSGSTTAPIDYTLSVSPLLGPLYGPDLWRVTDSAAPDLWSAPAQGWDTLNGSWCIHIPTSEAVVAVTDSQPGGGLAQPQGWVGYLHLSANAATWSAGDSGGKVVFAPAARC
jgi:hypothetical protein